MFLKNILNKINGQKLRKKSTTSIIKSGVWRIYTRAVRCLHMRRLLIEKGPGRGPAQQLMAPLQVFMLFM
jgi:hypothetical protein